MVVLETRWVKIMFYMYEKREITFKTQKIYRSRIFYDVMKEMVKAKWVGCRTKKLNGAVVKKSFFLTFEGKIVVEMFWNFIQEDMKSEKSIYFLKNNKKIWQK